MKTLLLVLGLLVGTSLTQHSVAQVSVQVNIGSQPAWGPTGYDYVDYYYLPDLDLYYYVPLQQWVYFDGVRWITTTVLPPRYQQYDLYQMHKVVINQKQPYLQNAAYRTRYATFKGKHDQQPIRDSRDAKYVNRSNGPQPTGRPGGQPNGPQMQGRPAQGRQAQGTPAQGRSAQGRPAQTGPAPGGSAGGGRGAGIAAGNQNAPQDHGRGRN